MPSSPTASAVTTRPRTRTAHHDTAVRRPDHDALHPLFTAPAETADATTAAAASAPAAGIEGIGDIAMAGAASGYAHLTARGIATLGQLADAARGAADALGRPTLWPRRRGRWQPAPRAARRGAAGRMRVSVVALEPNAFVAPGADRPERGRGHAARSELVFLVHGRAHLISTGPGGAMLGVQELAGGRARVLGAAGGHQLVNTGDTVAVVVRVSA